MVMNSKRPDTELIANYLDGDEQSLELLIKRYLKPIFGFTYKYVGNSQDAEDITQETFVKIWRHLKKFDRKKSFKTWIFTIAKNTAIDFLKKKKAIPLSKFDNKDGEGAFADTLADSSPLPSEILEQKNLILKLTKTLNTLLPKYKIVMSLYYNEGLNFREIAGRMGESINTIKSRHRRALVALKKLLPDYFEPEEFLHQNNVFDRFNI